MKPILSLAFLALLPATASAQETETQKAWRQFLAQNGLAWGITWNPATGSPDAIYGQGLRVAPRLATLEAAKPHAEAVLAKYATLLGAGNFRFVETYSGTIRHLHYFSYKQQYRRLDVRQAGADVRINQNGVVSMFGSSAVKIPNGFVINPAIDAVAARKSAEQFVLGKKGKPGLAARLLIFAEPHGNKPTRPVLAWEIEINELPQQLAAGRCYIDAMNGSVLHFQNDIVYCAGCGKNHMPKAPHEARLDRAMARRSKISSPAAQPTSPLLAITGTVMGWTNTAHTPNDPLKNIPLANLHVTSTAGNATTDAFGKFSIAYTGTANVTVNATLHGKHTQRIRVSSGTPMTASASIKPGTPGVVQFGTQAMSDQDRSQTTTYHFVDDVNTYVRGLVPKQPNAFAVLDQMSPRVNINSSCNAYYTRNTINFYNASSTCNMTAYEGVIFHEWAHGLDDVFGRIVFTDGLSEGWADVLTILRSQQPIVGPSFYKSRTPNYVRTALNNLRFPQGGGTHQKGQVWMGWVWDVRTDLAKTKGTAAAQLITERIVIPTIVANAPNLERQVLEVFLLDDDDGNLVNGTPNYFEMERACIKRNIKFPKISTGFITHSPLQGSKDQLTARAVVAKAIPITGSFSKVELVFDLGSGGVTRAMVPTGNKDEYIALIPGVLSPKVVQYSIVGTHSTSRVHRSPESGTYTYAIGNEVTLFSDDFEGSNKGWTTGVLSGSTNDFAIGTPTGVGGTTWNSQGWRDPKGAFSGTKSWGNNLGGAYSGNMSAYLRAPKLNMTGKTNIFLRFQRWLQVQESKYDTASIRLNGGMVWENSWTQHHVDSGWTKMDVRLAGADNNPNVQLEWILTSDGGMELAGWNIDDVALYTFTALPPPKLSLVITPSQVDLGKTSTITLKGTANAPVLLIWSVTPGPTNIPGLPTLRVGVPFALLSGTLNASGQLSLNFTAPTSTNSTGQRTYGQVLELTSPNTLTVSNPGLLLWGK